MRRYLFHFEGRIDGVNYYTVLLPTLDPYEYNVPEERCYSEYGFDGS